MDIVQLVFMLGPLLGAAAGYLLDGVTGARVIPAGPLVLAWLFGGALTMRPLRRGMGRIDHASP